MFYLYVIQYPLVSFEEEVRDAYIPRHPNP